MAKLVEDLFQPRHIESYEDWYRMRGVFKFLVLQKPRDKSIWFLLCTVILGFSSMTCGGDQQFPPTGSFPILTHTGDIRGSVFFADSLPVTEGHVQLRYPALNGLDMNPLFRERSIIDSLGMFRLREEIFEQDSSTLPSVPDSLKAVIRVEVELPTDMNTVTDSVEIFVKLSPAGLAPEVTPVEIVLQVNQSGSSL